MSAGMTCIARHFQVPRISWYCKLFWNILDIFIFYCIVCGDTVWNGILRPMVGNLIYIYIWLRLFLTRAVFSKGRKFDLCESYPRIIPQKITIMNVSFGIVWDCIGLTSYNGPDKLIDQCWRIFSTRTESHHYP